jgi:hypothetical protein
MSSLITFLNKNFSTNYICVKFISVTFLQINLNNWIRMKMRNLRDDECSWTSRVERYNDNKSFSWISTETEHLMI